MNTASEADLFEHLVVATACEFLSDLKLPGFCADIYKTLEQTPADAFPAEQWKEAIGDLFNVRCDGDAAVLRAKLMEQLRKGCRTETDNPGHQLPI